MTHVRKQEAVLFEEGIDEAQIGEESHQAKAALFVESADLTNSSGDRHSASALCLSSVPWCLSLLQRRSESWLVSLLNEVALSG